MKRCVAEPPELFRLKCGGHHHKGNTDSNTIQTEQFLVCRVTDTTTGSRIEQVYPARRRVQRYYNHIFYNTGIVVITSCSKYYYMSKLSKHYARHKFKVQSKSSGKITRWLQHVAKGYQASPSKVSLIVVIAGRGRIPLYGPARGQRAGPSQTSDLVLKTHT